MAADQLWAALDAEERSAANPWLYEVQPTIKREFPPPPAPPSFYDELVEKVASTAEEVQTEAEAAASAAKTEAEAAAAAAKAEAERLAALPGATAEAAKDRALLLTATSPLPHRGGEAACRRGQTRSGGAECAPQQAERGNQSGAEKTPPAEAAAAEAKARAVAEAKVEAKRLSALPGMKIAEARAAADAALSEGAAAADAAKKAVADSPIAKALAKAAVERRARAAEKRAAERGPPLRKKRAAERRAAAEKRAPHRVSVTS